MLLNHGTKIYKRLAVHLDSLPGGYPETDSGVELEILKKLFTPLEANLACFLTLLDEKPKVVAYRAGLSLATVRIQLKGMAAKGLIFETVDPQGDRLYMAAQFVVGIWEMQVGYLDKELADLFERYLPSLFDIETWKTVPQLRTIPVEKSIDPELQVLPYERARELIKDKTSFVVTPCICRKEKALGDQHCQKPLETCISFGREEDYLLSEGFGRKATREEVLEIMDLADQQGLVLQPNNGKEIKWICCCCGCCCGVLRTIKSFPRPNELTSSPFTLSVDIDVCDGCKKCIKCCQMSAITVVDKKVVWETERCIGCGLCVTSCQTGTLRLLRKPAATLPKVPKNIVDASLQTLKLREKAHWPDLVKLWLRSKRDRVLARNYH